MSAQQSTPLDALGVLETLVPVLRAGAAYALQIQERISHQPDKVTPGGDPFSSALSDADISIQTAVEVAVLSSFPTMKFHGEEYASSVNTKYLSGTWWEEGSDDWVFLLDPIDGTRYYLDQGEFQVIFSIVNPHGFEASVFLFPRRGKMVYAIRGAGAFIGDIAGQPLREFQRLKLNAVAAPVFLSLGVEIKEDMLASYGVFHLDRDYQPGVQTPIYSDLFFGKLSGVVLNSAQLIDGAAAAFIALEAGALVTTHHGEPLPKPSSIDSEKRLEGLVISVDTAQHQIILDAIRSKR